MHVIWGFPLHKCTDNTFFCDVAHFKSAPLFVLVHFMFKVPITTASDEILSIYIFFSFFSENKAVILCVLCEFPAWQTIHMNIKPYLANNIKCQALFSPKCFIFQSK